METKIKFIGNIEGVNLYFDPLKKRDSFLVMEKNNNIKTGFFTKNSVLFESNAELEWSKISGIIGGFPEVDKFTKIKEKINEKN